MRIRFSTTAIGNLEIPNRMTHSEAAECIPSDENCTAEKMYVGESIALSVIDEEDLEQPPWAMIVAGIEMFTDAFARSLGGPGEAGFDALQVLAAHGLPHQPVSLAVHQTAPGSIGRRSG